MKIQSVLAACCLFFATSSQSASLADLIVQPYREINGKYYDLTARYAWLKKGPQEKPTGTGRNGRILFAQVLAPAGDWKGDEPLMPEWPIVTSYVVDQVLPDGILVHQERCISTTGSSHSDPAFFLKRYPKKTAVYEQMKIVFLAIRTGTYTFSDTSGASRTVQCLDCGRVVTSAELTKWRRGLSKQ